MKGKSGKQTAKTFRRREAKHKKRQARNNTDTLFVPVDVTGILKPQQGVTVSNYLSWFPQLLADPSSTISVQNANKFMVHAIMYDKVRINSMTLRIVPKANTLDQATAQNDATLTLTGDNMIHTCVDRNNCPPADITSLAQYSSYKAYDSKKPFVKTYKVVYPKGVWLDTLKGKIDQTDTTLLKKLGLLGGIYLYAENFVEDVGEIFNEPWANFRITYNCVFMGKSLPNLSASYNEDGSIKSLSLKPIENLTNPDQTLPTDVKGVTVFEEPPV